MLALEAARRRIRELEREHNLHRRLMDLMPLMLCVKDETGRFLMANHAMHDAYGLEDGALVGRAQATTHLGPDAVLRYQAADRRVMDSGERYDSKGSPFTRADGGQRIIDWIKVPWPTPDGDPRAVLLVGQDITERDEMERRLLRQERFATLGELTATVSHELRNPLAAMRPSLYTLQKHAEMSDVKVQRALTRLERGVSRCDAIIDQLLDFTRLKTLELDTVDLNAWLAEMLAELPHPKGLSVVTRFASTRPEVTMDGERLRQAVTNVWNNACEALASREEPSGTRDHATITVSTILQQDRVEIQVEDNGDGIAVDDLPRIFEPLFSTKGFGTGLGLPLVRQVLEQHDGGVTVSSTPGKGSLVLLWLPRGSTARSAAGP